MNKGTPKELMGRLFLVIFLFFIMGTMTAMIHLLVWVWVDWVLSEITLTGFVLMWMAIGVVCGSVWFLKEQEEV